MKILEVLGNTEVDAEFSGKWKGKITASLAAPLEKIWEVASDFSGLHKFVPMVEICERVKGCNHKPGCIRFYSMNSPIGLPGGKRKAWSRDRLMKIEEETHSYTYAVEESNMNLENCEISFKATDGTDGSTKVKWSWEMDPTKKSTRERTLGDMSEFGCAFIKGVEAAATKSLAGASNLDFEGQFSANVFHYPFKDDKDNHDNRYERIHNQGISPILENEDDLSDHCDKSYSKAAFLPFETSRNLDLLTQSLSEISQKLDCPIPPQSYQHELECLQIMLADGRCTLVSHMDHYMNDFCAGNQQLSSSSVSPENSNDSSNVGNSFASSARQFQLAKAFKSKEATCCKLQTQETCSQPLQKRVCCSETEGLGAHDAGLPAAREARAKDNQVTMMALMKEQDQQHADVDLASQGVYTAFQNFTNQFHSDLHEDVTRQLAFVKMQLETVGYKMQEAIRIGVEDGTFKVLSYLDPNDKNGGPTLLDPCVLGNEPAWMPRNTDYESRMGASPIASPLSLCDSTKIPCQCFYESMVDTIPLAQRGHTAPLHSSPSLNAKTICSSSPFELKAIAVPPIMCGCFGHGLPPSHHRHDYALPLRTLEETERSLNPSPSYTSYPLSCDSKRLSSHLSHHIEVTQHLEKSPASSPQHLGAPIFSGGCICQSPTFMPAHYGCVADTQIFEGSTVPIVDSTAPWKSTGKQQYKNKITSIEQHHDFGFGESATFRHPRLQGSLQSIDSIRFRSSQIYQDLIQEEMCQDFQDPSKSVIKVIQKAPSAQNLLQDHAIADIRSSSCSKGHNVCDGLSLDEDGVRIEAGLQDASILHSVNHICHATQKGSSEICEDSSEDSFPKDVDYTPKGWTQRASQIHQVAKEPDDYKEDPIVVHDQQCISLDHEHLINGLSPCQLQMKKSSANMMLDLDLDSNSQEQRNPEHSCESQEAKQSDCSPFLSTSPVKHRVVYISDKDNVGKSSKLASRNGKDSLFEPESKAADNDVQIVDVEKDNGMSSSFCSIPCDSFQGSIPCSEKLGAMLDMGKEIAPRIFHNPMGDQTRVIANVLGNNKIKDLKIQGLNSLAQKDKISQDFAAAQLKKNIVVAFQSPSHDKCLSSEAKVAYYADGRAWNSLQSRFANPMELTSTSMITSNHVVPNQDDAFDIKTSKEDFDVLRGHSLGILTCDSNPQLSQTTHIPHMQGANSLSQIAQVKSSEKEIEVLDCDKVSTISLDSVHKQVRKSFKSTQPSKHCSPCRSTCTKSDPRSTKLEPKTEHIEVVKIRYPFDADENWGRAQVLDGILPTASINIDVFQQDCQHDMPKFQCNRTIAEWIETQSPQISDRILTATAQLECSVHANVARAELQLQDDGESWHNNFESSLTEDTDGSWNKNRSYSQRRKPALPSHQREAASLSNTNCLELDKTWSDDSIQNTTCIDSNSLLSEISGKRNLEQTPEISLEGESSQDNVEFQDASSDLFENERDLRMGETSNHQMSNSLWLPLQLQFLLPFPLSFEVLAGPNSQPPLSPSSTPWEEEQAPPAQRFHEIHEVQDVTAISLLNDRSPRKVKHGSKSDLSISSFLSTNEGKNTPLQRKSLPIILNEDTPRDRGLNDKSRYNSVSHKLSRDKLLESWDTEVQPKAPDWKGTPVETYMEQQLEGSQDSQSSRSSCDPTCNYRSKGFEGFHGSRGAEGSYGYKCSNESSKRKSSQNLSQMSSEEFQHTHMLNAMLDVNDFMDDLRSYSQMLDDMAQQEQQTRVHPKSSYVGNKEPPYLTALSPTQDQDKQITHRSQTSLLAREKGKQIQEISPEEHHYSSSLHQNAMLKPIELSLMVPYKGAESKSEIPSQSQQIQQPEEGNKMGHRSKQKEERIQNTIVNNGVRLRDTENMETTRSYQIESRFLNEDNPNQSKTSYDPTSRSRPKEPQFQEDSGINFLNSISKQILDEFSMAQNQSSKNGAQPVQSIELRSNSTQVMFLDKISQQIVDKFTDDIDDYSSEPNATLSRKNDDISTLGQPNSLQQQQTDHEPQFREGSAVNFLNALSNQVQELQNWRRNSEPNMSRRDKGLSSLSKISIQKNYAANFLDALKADVISQGNLQVLLSRGVKDEDEFTIETDKSSTFSEPIAREVPKMSDFSNVSRVHCLSGHQSLETFDFQSETSPNIISQEYLQKQRFKSDKFCAGTDKSSTFSTAIAQDAPKTQKQPKAPRHRYQNLEVSDSQPGTKVKWSHKVLQTGTSSSCDHIDEEQHLDAPYARAQDPTAPIRRGLRSSRRGTSPIEELNKMLHDLETTVSKNCK